MGANCGRARAALGHAPVGTLGELGLQDLVEGLLIERRLVSRHIFSYSGPEIPPSLRIRQKWTDMKTTITKGKAST